MKQSPVQAADELFEHHAAIGPVPSPRRDRIDIALLDTGALRFDSGVVRVLREVAESLREDLERAGVKLRTWSFGVVRDNALPEPRRFAVHMITGREQAEDSGATESPENEAALFRLFDAILAEEDASMFAVGDTFPLLCRWSGVARIVARTDVRATLTLNRLSREAMHHPWFAQFARELSDHQHFRVVDRRAFDAILGDSRKSTPIAFEASEASALTMLELARDRDGVMPRFLAIAHHPELIDRGSIAHADYDRESRLMLHYALLEPLRFSLRREIEKVRRQF